jgi:adenylate kinase
LVLLGPPGAGKGTQAALLSNHFHVPHISTGDILRAETSRGTELGARAKECMDRGELVPDELMLGIIRERLKQPDAVSGFLLDGFPRSLAQARGLEEILAGNGIPLSVVSLEVPSEEVVRRLSGRRTCRSCGAMYHLDFEPSRTDGVCDRCGAELYQRADDREDIIEARLEVYRKETEPLLSFYRERGLLRSVDGTGSSGQVSERVLRAVDGAA